MSASAKETKSPAHYAKALGRRLDALGLDIYASDKERYLVLLQDSPGEIIDLGRPLRGSRIFGHEAIRKNAPVVADFSNFAREDGLQDCMFWGIGLTGAKAKAEDLVSALKGFNKKINVEFSELRKKLNFELLLITLHPKFDSQTGLFDLHAHFICRVQPQDREAVHRKIMSKFSKVDLNTFPIRNPAATATYMLWGIWRNKAMLDWPDHALKAAWEVTQHRLRLFRTGGGFAKWRASRRHSGEKRAKIILDKEMVKKNRAETAYKQHPKNSDKLLSKIMIGRFGKKVAALLYEKNTSQSNEAANEKVKNPGVVYSSATIVVTQESTKTNSNDINRDRRRPRNHVLKVAHRCVRHIPKLIMALTSKIHKIVRHSAQKARYWMGIDPPT